MYAWIIPRYTGHVIKILCQTRKRKYLGIYLGISHPWIFTTASNDCNLGSQATTAPGQTDSKVDHIQSDQHLPSVRSIFLTTYLGSLLHLGMYRLHGVDVLVVV